MEILEKSVAIAAFTLMYAAFSTIVVVTLPLFAVADMFMGDDQTL